MTEYLTFSTNPFYDDKNAFVRGKLTDPRSGSLIYVTHHIFERPKNLLLQDPKIQIIFDEDNNTLTLTTESFAYYVWVSLSNEDDTLKLSDNYFDISVGLPKTLSILSNHEIADIRDKIKVRSLWDTYN